MPVTLFSRFEIGANLPWVNYGTDIGSNAWRPAGGLASHASDLGRVDDALQRMADQDVRIVRAFLLCDGRAGIRWQTNELASGIDDAVLRDIDVLLDAARRHGVQLMPVVFDFGLALEAEVVNGVQIRGHRDALRGASGRAALVDRVLRPIVQRFGQHESVAAWDVFNEPEWLIARQSWLKGAHVSRRAMRAFLEQSVACVRAFATQPITVGSAHARRPELVRGLDLDFYQVHWYSSFGWPALLEGPRAFGDDRPVLLGECSGRDGTYAVKDVLNAARQAGYASALLWSLLAQDGESGWPEELVSAFTQTHHEPVQAD